LSIAAARVVKPPGPRRLQARNRGQDLAEHLAQRTGLDAALCLNGRQLFRIQAPDLASVGEVEVPTDRGAQTALQDRGERRLVLPVAVEWPGLLDEVGGSAQREGRRQGEH